MWPVNGGIELADAIRTRTRIREAQSALLALDDDKPQPGAADGVVGCLHQLIPVAGIAQQAVRFFPVNLGQTWGRRDSLIPRKIHAIAPRVPCRRAEL